jgi:6-pyruvoyltetrahydropterin/6-carboxytetrahydropterin synthase
MKRQNIIRSCTFDSGHRVMNEKMKCFNMHGHTYLCDVDFEFYEMEDIGYAIDFKEIKRVGLQWIDDLLDHIFQTGMDPSYEITKNGKRIGEMASDLLPN